MTLHVPSLFVGCVFAGASFLLVHQQLSYRERLTNKWKLRELAESRFRSMMHRPTQDEKKFTGPEYSFRKKWNQAIDYLQSSLDANQK